MSHTSWLPVHLPTLKQILHLPFWDETRSRINSYMAAYTSAVCWPLHSSAGPLSLWGAWWGLGWGDCEAQAWSPLTGASAEYEGPLVQWSCFLPFPLVEGWSCHLQVKSQNWDIVSKIFLRFSYSVFLFFFSTCTFVAEVVLAASSIAGRTGRARGPVFVRWMAPPVSPVRVI